METPHTQNVENDIHLRIEDISTELDRLEREREKLMAVLEANVDEVDPEVATRIDQIDEERLFLSAELLKQKQDEGSSRVSENIQ